MILCQSNTPKGYYDVNYDGHSAIPGVTIYTVSHVSERWGEVVYGFKEDYKTPNAHWCNVEKYFKLINKDIFYEFANWCSEYKIKYIKKPLTALTIQ